MRDWRGRSPDPKPIGDALGVFREEIAPETPVAGVQLVWDRVVGERIAAVTEVAGEQDGVVTVECRSSVWAQELEMMKTRILGRLRAEMGDSGPDDLRFRASG